jgi:hypothetical protein
MKIPVKAEIFINNPGEFFHYEPFFTSSFSKNLIIPEAAIFSKSESVVHYLSPRGVFLNTRFMDNLFLNRMNSRQGIIKKKQETIC